MGFVRFQDLNVYQLAENFADAVWDMVGAWSPLARDTVGKQLIRAADSIGANIAEGCGLDSHNNNRRHVRIARGSFLESQHWLRRAFRRKLLTPEQTTTLQSMVEALAPTLNAYMKSIGKGPKPKPTPHPDTNGQTLNTKH
jgi:four helix bundle protein